MDKFGTAIILAGGKSTRMGFDKQFLELKEGKLIDILISKLKEEFQEIIIVTNKPEEYKGMDAIVTMDIIKDMGPLGGIHSGLTSSSSFYSFVLACDMPNIDLKYIRHLKSILEEKQVDICISKINDYIEPFMGFYSRNIVDSIEKNLLEGKRAIRSIIKSNNTFFNEEYISEKIFLNLNTKEDLKEIEK